MRKVIVLTLGFDEKFAYRAILRHDVREGDVLILISGKMNERVLKAYNMVEEFLKKSFGEQVGLELLEVDPSDVIETIRRIIGVISQYKDRRIIVNLSGGMRAIIVSALLAILLADIRNVHVEIELEDLSGIASFPGHLLRLVSEDVRETSLEILRSLSEGSKSVKELAKVMGKDDSTVRKKTQELEALGLVRALKRKPLVLEITELGRLLLRATA